MSVVIHLFENLAWFALGALLRSEAGRATSTLRVMAKRRKSKDKRFG